MSDPLERFNAALASASPALFAALSPLGRRIYFPADIPFQAAEARGKEINATIGQITDGAGGALVPLSLARGLAALGEGERNRALLYSPVEGFADLRRAWARWQSREMGREMPATTLPFVTAGLTHGLSLVADLFGGEGRTVLIPAPFWGNYRQCFGARTGARVVPVPSFTAEGFDAEPLAGALAALPRDEPAVVVLNLPSNPSGYSLAAAERSRLGEALGAAASERPLVVVCDDAYAGLVFEPEVPRASLFWDLATAHPNLVAVKVDGATKELSFFGGRLGFLTFALAADSDAAPAIESKLKGLLRAGLGSPIATTQVLALAALESPTIEAEVEAIRALLAERYRALRAALSGVDPGHLRPLPFNSGCFALVELPAGLDPERARQHLLATQSTGLVAVAPRYLRIAHCSVAAGVLPELVRRLALGVAQLA